MSKLEEVRAVLSYSIQTECWMRRLEDIWRPNTEQRHLHAFSTHLHAKGGGDGGLREPTCVIASSSWSCCSHPRWLNALFNSFLNIPCPAVVWQRICCMTTGKLYKILTLVSLPQLDQSPCSDYCPPALSCTHKTK